MLARTNDFLGRWWHLLVSFAAICVIFTMGYVFVSLADDRDEQVKARKLAEERNDQLSDIIDAEREDQATRDERLNDAVGKVRQVLAEVIQEHDAQMNRLMARQLDQIAQLLNRPEGTPPDPVTSRPQPGQDYPPATSAPAPAQRSATPAPTPEPAPAPTTPDQKNCTRRPDGPRC